MKNFLYNQRNFQGPLWSEQQRVSCVLEPFENTFLEIYGRNAIPGTFQSASFGLDEIQATTNTLYIDPPSRPGIIHNMTGGGAAMTMTRGARKVRCYVQLPRFRAYHARLCKQRWNRFDAPKWCLLRNSTTHSDAENIALKGKEDTKTPRQGEVHSAHTMTGPAHRSKTI